MLIPCQLPPLKKGKYTYQILSDAKPYLHTQERVSEFEHILNKVNGIPTNHHGIVCLNLNLKSLKRNNFNNLTIPLKLRKCCSDSIEIAMAVMHRCDGIQEFNFLLQGDESGRVSRTDTRSTVLHRLVSDGKFPEVMTNHFRFDFNLI